MCLLKTTQPNSEIESLSSSELIILTIKVFVDSRDNADLISFDQGIDLERSVAKEYNY